MPHHSAHQRQMSASAMSPAQAHAGSFAMPSSISFPPQTAPGMVVPSRPGDYHSPGLVQSHHHIVPHNKSWTSASPDGVLVHRVGSHGDTSESAATAVLSRQNSSHSQHLTPTRARRLSTSNSTSFESPHGVAASVLLLAASKIREEEEATTTTSTLSPNGPVTTADVPRSAEPSPSVPLKKRKNASDIMRIKPDEASASSPSSHAHVSPISHGTHPSTSTPTSIASPDTAHHSSSSQSSLHHHHHTGTTPSSSYELKDGLALPDSAKIIDTKDISCPPPTHVEIPHFPSVLHAVLTQSEFADSVLQWLPHGQAWKIVRWDALKRQVLPKYFAQLRDDKDGSASIDAFLWHLRAWGFEEITHGPDAGAYTNVLFRRELSQLCREMRFSPPSDKRDDMPTEDTRNILRVPSLTSHGMERGQGEEKKEDDHASHHNMVPPAWRSTNMAYRPANHMMPRHDVWKTYSPETPYWVNSPAHHDVHRVVPPYSPIRVRSSRGAARTSFPMHQQRQHYQQSPQSMASPQELSGGRIGFPVSNRGRGGPAARRIITTPIKQSGDSLSAAVASAAASSAAPVPIAVVEPSKPRPILKRKLPMTKRLPTDETMSDTDDSCTSTESPSKRSKLSTTLSEDSLDAPEAVSKELAAH